MTNEEYLEQKLADALDEIKHLEQELRSMQADVNYWQAEAERAQYYPYRDDC